jgi:hypothetical protein
MVERLMESPTPNRLLARIEGLENFFQLVARQSRPMIGNPDLDQLPASRR